MTPVFVIKLFSLILWCHAAVLVVAWFRAVARCDVKTHVGAFVALMGALVPVSSGLVLVVLAGATLGLPSAVAFLAILIPGGLAVALNGEVARLGPYPQGVEAGRVAVSLLLFLAALIAKGGL
ncbi:MAG: hypothetical protein KDA50_01410 [Rhodobacteraceae bacterium]|nr:hypothetical protein [Paracoccaceae bacterium]